MYIVYKVELPSLVGQMGVDPTGARIHLGRYRTRGEPANHYTTDAIQIEDHGQTI
jgi:hypothetical protein